MNNSDSRALILVVDDVEEDRVYMRAILEGAGYDVVAADSAEAGLQLARQKSPTLIVMDVKLPGINGLEATRRLKSDPLTARTPVIVVTAHETDRRGVRDGRYEAFLKKPVDSEALIGHITRLLETPTL